MVRRREASALVLVVAFVLSVAAVVVVAQKKDDKRDDAQKKEIQAAVKLADDAAAGQPAPNDLGLTWMHEDYMKAASNKEYVPFTVGLDPSKATGVSVALYWRVVSKTDAPPLPAPPQKKDNRKDAKDTKRDFAYEDVSFFGFTTTTLSATTTATTTTTGTTTTTTATTTINPPTAGRQPAPIRISRSFIVPAGTYDVFVVAREVAQKNAPAPKVSVLKQTVTVPEFWNGDLNTSSVIVAQRIDPLPAPLTPQQQADRPYALGSMEILPALDTKLSKKSELSVYFLVYNPKSDSANKPDVTVEYNFYAKSGGAEKFFNKTAPLNLNAQTLQPQFDLTAGHQLQGGSQAIPLAAFPEGDYRLEIKVTDKIANKSVTRDVNFTVTT